MGRVELAQKYAAAAEATWAKLRYAFLRQMIFTTAGRYREILHPFWVFCLQCK